MPRHTKIPFPDLNSLGGPYTRAVRGDEARRKLVIERVDLFWEHIRSSFGEEEGPHVARVHVNPEDYSRLRAWIAEPLSAKLSKKRLDREMFMLMFDSAPAVDVELEAGTIRVDADAFIPPAPLLKKRREESLDSTTCSPLFDQIKKRS